METPVPEASLELNPLILRRLGGFLLDNDLYAEQYLLPSMREAFGLFAYNDTVDTQEAAQRLGLEHLADVDSRSVAIARHLWTKFRGTLKLTEEAQAINTAIDNATARFAERPEGQPPMPLPESIPEPLSSSRAAWRTETLRRIHHILLGRSINPQELLVNNILCQSAYPYFVGGVHIPKTRKFVTSLQDETIKYLSELVPELLGFAPFSNGEEYAPYPAPIDPARIPWRKGERREIIPFIHRQLTVVSIPPTSVLSPDLMDVYDMAASTAKSTTTLAKETGDNIRTISEQVGRIVELAIENVPADKLQLRRLREMASYVLLGIAPPPSQTRRRDVKMPEMAEVPANAPWRRGEQLEVVRQLYGLLEARGHDPTEVLNSKTLGWYYEVATGTDTPFTTFITDHGLDRTRARKNLKAIIEKFVSIVPPETLALAGRRREARIHLQARYREGSWQRHLLPPEAGVPERR